MLMLARKSRWFVPIGIWMIAAAFASNVPTQRIEPDPMPTMPNGQEDAAHGLYLAHGETDVLCKAETRGVHPVLIAPEPHPEPQPRPNPFAYYVERDFSGLHA